MKEDLTTLDSHFAFGENWKDFVSHVSEERIAEATKGLTRLFPNDELRGKRFLDVGCGSGLSMLAALRLGAAHVAGLDIDPSSVEAANALLTGHADRQSWEVHERSALASAVEDLGSFDIVYSWGVLHHSGDMWQAVRKTSRLVNPNGYFAVALYRRTPMDRFWVVEKRLYSRASPILQRLIRWIYCSAFFAAKLLSGRNPVAYVKDYAKKRGMNWAHDVHDWLGGYPYETQTPGEVASLLAADGFTLVREYVDRTNTVGLGLFGSNVDEFVLKREQASQ